MKKFAACVVFMLSVIFMMLITASAASDITVDKIEYTAELKTDGTAYINEIWTVTTGDNPEGFCRRIALPTDEFESFSEMKELAVSVDGVVYTQSTDGFTSNDTYSLTKNPDGYCIDLNFSEKNTTHTFTLRYIKTGTVKFFEGSAYFYTTVVNADDSYGICHDVTVNISTQSRCFSENFTVVESGSLAGKKSDSSIVFTADNAAGLVKVAISVPAETFDAKYIPSLDKEEPDNDMSGIIICLCCLIAVVAAAAYVGCRKKLFRKTTNGITRYPKAVKLSKKIISGYFIKLRNALPKE